MFDRGLWELPGFKKQLILNILISCAVALFDILQSWFLALCIVEVWQGSAAASVGIYLGAFIVSYLLRTFVKDMQETHSMRYAIDVSAGLERSYARSMLVSSLVMPGDRTSSLTINAVEGIDQALSYIMMTLVKISRLIAVTSLICIVILLFDPISGIILIVLFPFVIIFMRLIGHTAHDESAKKKDSFNRMSNHFLDAVRGLPTLIAFDRARGYGADVEAVSEKHRAMVMKTLRIATLSSTVLDLFSVCGLAAIAIMLGFRIVEGDMSFLTGMFVLLLTPEAFLPIRSYAADYHATLDGKNSLDSILTSMRSSEKYPDFVSAPSDDMLGFDVDTSGGSLDLELSHVDYDYDGISVLEDVNAHFEGPGICVVMGQSGAGKSTLLDIASGFRDPSRGCVKLNGNVLSRDQLNALRRHIAYIPQSPYLFQGSIKDNVLLYRKDASDAELSDVIDAVGLNDLMQELPDGIDTIIGDGSRKLSGGEAHRIALARALIDTERSIWIMDEPTAHLDVMTEYDLKQRIVQFASDHLIIFATHRAHWLDSARTVYAIAHKKAEVPASISAASQGRS